MTTQTKYVEGGIALSCEASPVGNRKQFGNAHYASKKMILPCPYGLFGRVRAMDVRWSVHCSMGTNVLMSLYVLLSSLCSRGLKPCTSEPGIDLSMCTKKLFYQAILDGNGAKRVGVEC